MRRRSWLQKEIDELDLSLVTMGRAERSKAQSNEEDDLVTAKAPRLRISLRRYLAVKFSRKQLLKDVAVKQASNEVTAPKGLLIDMLTPPAHAEEALANITARYEHWVAKYGQGHANRIFHSQCVGVVVTFWVDWAMKRLKLLQLMRPSP